MHRCQRLHRLGSQVCVRVRLCYRRGGGEARYVAAFPGQRARKKNLRNMSVPWISSWTGRTITVMSDEINWPMAEIINNGSDQNL